MSKTENGNKKIPKGCSVYFRKDVLPEKPWQALIRENGRTAESERFATKEEGEAFVGRYLARIKAEAEASSLSLLPPSGDMRDEKLEKTLRLFLASPECKKHHRHNAEIAANHVGEATIRDIRKPWILNYVATLLTTNSRYKRPYRHGSIAKQLKAIRAATQWRAEHFEVILPRLVYDTSDWPSDERNRRLDDPEEGGVEERMITHHFRKRGGHMNYHMRLLVKLAIETGARAQEMVLAERREFKMGAHPYWSIPKEHVKTKRARVVPLTFKAVRVVKALILLLPPNERRMFHTIKNPHSASDAFYKAKHAMGLVDLTLHDLRHEGVSRFTETQTGYELHECMEIMGHRSIAMHNRYKHIRGAVLAKKIIKT
jgi:integrase